MLKLLILLRPYAKYLLSAWLVTIIIVSSTPNITVPKIHTAGTVIRLDYLIHFLEYGLLTGLSFLTFTGERFIISFHRVAALAAILILFAILDEYHQKLIPGRTFNPIDLYCNIAGIISGVVISVVLFRIIARKRMVEITETV